MEDKKGQDNRSPTGGHQHKHVRAGPNPCWGSISWGSCLSQVFGDCLCDCSCSDIFGFLRSTKFQLFLCATGCPRAVELPLSAFAVRFGYFSASDHLSFVARFAETWHSSRPKEGDCKGVIQGPCYGVLVTGLIARLHVRSLAWLMCFCRWATARPPAWQAFARPGGRQGSNPKRRDPPINKS